MAIDRMDWHYGSDGFPDDVPEENAGVHIGFFLTWAFEQGLAGDIHTEEEPEAIAQLLRREITGVEFLIKYCDEKLWGEDFNETGEAFAVDYYQEDNGSFARQYAHYLQDFNDTFSEYADYRVPDTWEHYDRIKALLNQRFSQWQQWKQAV